MQSNFSRGAADDCRHQKPLTMSGSPSLGEMEALQRDKGGFPGCPAEPCHRRAPSLTPLSVARERQEPPRGGDGFNKSACPG